MTVFLKGSIFPATGDWTAWSLVDGESACSLHCDGGKVRVLWCISDPARREAASAWLTTRAREVWSRSRKGDASFLGSLEAAARLAVPETLWAGLEARHGRSARALKKVVDG